MHYPAGRVPAGEHERVEALRLDVAPRDGLAELGGLLHLRVERFGLGLGVVGLWWGLSAGLSVTAVILLVVFLRITRPDLRAAT